MKEYTKKEMPKRSKSISNLGGGTFIMKISNEEFYVCKKAQNGGVFKDACSNLTKYNKGKTEDEKVVKFENEEETLNYLNNMAKKFNKEKHLQKSLNALPSDHKKAVIETILLQPNLKVGVQKSMILGFMDLPLFGGIDDKQTKLF